MRAFIAIELPEDIRKYLVEIQKQIGDSNAKIKWVEEENIHLTLKFLGDVEEDKIEDVKNILSGIKVKPIDAKIDGVGVFPAEDYIRVVWVGLKPGTRFIELANEIDNKLSPIVPKEKREFKSHVTLARVKFVKDKKAFVEGLKSIKVEAKEFKVEGFVLKKSTLTKQGPVYEDIAKF